MGRMIRKRTRHCGRYGISAPYVQVSYFPYEIPKVIKGRQRKHEVTAPAKRLINSRESERYVEALIMSNFRKGDLLLGLSYSEENLPRDEEEAKRKFYNFIRRVNHRRKKEGLSKARWVCITETSAKGRIHHHVMMDAGLDRDTVEEIWGQEGLANSKRLQHDGVKGLLGVSSYLVKAFKEDSNRPRNKRRWHSSTNLTRPWDTVNDNPRMMSKKKFRLMQELPEDAEQMKTIIELDNPGYELIRVEKKYCEEEGNWHFFCRMQLSTNPTEKCEKTVDKKRKEQGHGNHGRSIEENRRGRARYRLTGRGNRSISPGLGEV